jgi:gliding motility-associated-like protein
MKNKVIIFFLLTLSTFVAMAQPYVSNLGRFEVDEMKGCAPFTVTGAIRPPFVCNGANPCDSDFENSSNFQLLNTATFTHTYTQPGTYTLRILFQTSGFDEITIVVTPNVSPAFEIYSCGGNETQVKVTDTNYNQYVINYNDGSPDVVVPSGSLAKDNHTFVSSGNKTITVRGRNLGADDNCNPANQVVNALLTLPPPTITRLVVLDNAQIQLDFNNQQNILYKLEIATNSTNFQQLQNVYNTATTTIGNLRTDDNFYCFRLGAFDPCNNVTVYSNVICSSNFDLSTQNNVNKLTWTTDAAGVSNYSIAKSNSAPLAAANTATTVDDTNIICGTDYCYQLTSNYSNGSQSISLQKCGTAVSTTIPTSIENISAIVTGNNTVDLQWTQDPAFTAASYMILKSGSSVGTSTSTLFTDTQYSSEAGACYKISYTDVCNNNSLTSADACPINLAGTLQPNNVISLNWTAYTGWKNGVDQYVVEKFNAQGQLLLSFNTGSATGLVDNEEDFVNQVYLYRVTAIPNDPGIASSVSNTITIIKEPNLFHPSAFTPNSNGLNDLFKVFGQFIAAVEFKIFNRWGELLFITNDLDKGWDGTYKGSAMPEGTYVFRANLTDLAGRTSERSGTILLLRKGQ